MKDDDVGGLRAAAFGEILGISQSVARGLDSVLLVPPSLLAVAGVVGEGEDRPYLLVSCRGLTARARSERRRPERRAMRRSIS